MLNRKHSEETRKKQAVAHVGHFKKGGNRLEGAGLPAQKILVLDINTNESTTYDSIHATSRALNIIASTIYNYINRKQKKPSPPEGAKPPRGDAPRGAQKGRPISSAILKYGLVNFAFVIIEEVDTDLYNIEERETY
jgi:hypothetical protein